MKLKEQIQKRTLGDWALIWIISCVWSKDGIINWTRIKTHFIDFLTDLQIMEYLSKSFQLRVFHSKIGPFRKSANAESGSLTRSNEIKTIWIACIKLKQSPQHRFFTTPMEEFETGENKPDRPTIACSVLLMTCAQLQNYMRTDKCYGTSDWPTHRPTDLCIESQAGDEKWRVGYMQYTSSFAKLLPDSDVERCRNF